MKKKITNKDRVAKVLKKDDFKIGIFDERLNDCSVGWCKIMIELSAYPGDRLIKIQRVPDILEVSQVDDEIDYRVITPEGYESLYGRAFGEEY